MMRSSSYNQPNYQPCSEKDTELLSAYLDNQLNGVERDTLEQRLRVEPALHAELEALQSVVQLCRELVPPPLPRSFTLDMATFQHPQRKRAWWRGSWGWTGAGVLATMLVALVVVSLVATTPTNLTPHVSQSASVEQVAHSTEETVTFDGSYVGAAPDEPPAVVALAPSAVPARTASTTDNTYTTPAWMQPATLTTRSMTPVPSVESRSFITRPSQVKPTVSLDEEQAGVTMGDTPNAMLDQTTAIDVGVGTGTESQMGTDGIIEPGQASNVAANAASTAIVTAPSDTPTSLASQEQASVSILTLAILLLMIMVVITGVVAYVHRRRNT